MHLLCVGEAHQTPEHPQGLALFWERDGIKGLWVERRHTEPPQVGPMGSELKDKKELDRMRTAMTRTQRLPMAQTVGDSEAGTGVGSSGWAGKVCDGAFEVRWGRDEPWEKAWHCGPLGPESQKEVDLARGRPQGFVGPAD